jgi:hypothetical protein
MPYLILTSTQYVVHNGKTIRLKPGDGFNLKSNQVAKEWLEKGLAELPPKYHGGLESVYESGIVVKGDTSALPPEVDRAVSFSGNYLQFEFTCFWDQSELPALRTDLLPVGFNLLKTWQLAIPLYDYDVLACDIAGDELKAIIRDLRVPLYDPRFFFVRRCDDTRALLSRYDELCAEQDSRVAMLQAIYEHKPLLSALPTTWTCGRDVIGEL